MFKTKKFLMMFFFMMSVLVISAVLTNKDIQASGKLKIVVKKSTSIKLTGAKKIKVKVYFDGENVTKDATIKFKNSNNKIVSITESDEDTNYDYVDGFEALSKKIGKSKVSITATYSPHTEYDRDEAWIKFHSENSKNYATFKDLEQAFDEIYDFDYSTYKATAKCTIKVQPYNSMRAQASLDSYNTRKNVFGIKVYNISTKTIKINSKGAAVYEDDYTSFDRNLKLTRGRRSVSIKPGQTKMVYFSVIGRITWYRVDDFQLCSNWTWGGKTHRVSLNTSEESYAYIGKHWKWIGYA